MNNDHRLLSSGKHVELAVLGNGVAIVTFNSVGSRVNLLSSEVMKELDAVVAQLSTGVYVHSASSINTSDDGVFGDDLRTIKRFKGVVFRSAKDGCFIAGADIKEIQNLRTRPAGEAFEGCQRGKALLERIAALPLTTVAAINGRSLGGGTELALACKKRLAADNKQTVLGLPEVGLGVLPGWGGTVRVPRMIGFFAALQLICNPLAAFSAKKAWRRGLVSELVPENRLFARAVEVALGSPTKGCLPTFDDRCLRSIFDSKPGRAVAGATMRALVRLKTGGKLPAFGKAIDVMNASFVLPSKQAFEFESRTFAQLVHTDACGKCVQKFIDYQKAKKSRAAA
jgi:3-hydroxyacyl-CoA dehydrogenase/enoyl-CoA hydratase/3-hydroxybutyryl-CoA epimerase